MGRIVPSSPNETNHSVHLVVAVSLIAATISIIATLCASWHRKSSSEKPPSKYPPTPQSNSSSRKEKTEEATTTLAAIEVTHEQHHHHQQQHPHQSPQVPNEKVVLDVATHGPILPNVDLTPEQSSRRKLSMSLSMKLPEGLSKIRTGKREQKTSGAAEEETIWKKTIILGEKCRVPSEDGGDDDDAVSVSIEKAMQRNYHPRTPRSLPVSRTNSFTNAEMALHS